MKKKTSIATGFIEEEKFIIATNYRSSKTEEVGKLPEPTKQKLTTPAEGKEADKKAVIKLPKLEVKNSSVEEEGSIIEKGMKKFMDQKINLTLEEIVTMSPNYNMEASTIEVEPVQKKGLKPKELVKIASNKYGKNDNHFQWDFQYPATQPTIKEEINPTKIQNIITTPELEPKSSNLETKLSEEQSIKTQEPLDLDQVIEKINFMELEMKTTTASTANDDSQKNPFSHLSPNSGLK
ncbi:hypothetical protein O181_024940 [Austropuccinia psidii MF-1]|uniref:Uncharacterized protein n=1 Tax=Austropuccinia psidii MF-1 TaxID=1389203 RepID=A0A9Q3CLH3_9BASI|nr:hypothetical protein [Austropuccinia psidii MF-1]